MCPSHRKLHLSLQCLSHAFPREERQNFWLQDIWEAENDFLDARCFEFGQASTDGIRSADERAQERGAVPPRGGEFCLRLLIGFSDSTRTDGSTTDTIVITSDGYAVLFENGQFALNSRQIANDIAGISVLSDQLERDLLAPTGDEQGNVRLLDTLGLVDRTSDVVIGALESRFLLRPHGENNLHGLA